MSPGFTPRPSLSERRIRPGDSARGSVAGVHAPAFVERATRPRNSTASARVSPGFTPRPSLSVLPFAATDEAGGCRRGSRPGLR